MKRIIRVAVIMDSRQLEAGIREAQLLLRPHDLLIEKMAAAYERYRDAVNVKRRASSSGFTLGFGLNGRRRPEFVRAKPARIEPKWTTRRRDTQYYAIRGKLKHKTYRKG